MLPIIFFHMYPMNTTLTNLLNTPSRYPRVITSYTPHIQCTLFRLDDFVRFLYTLIITYLPVFIFLFLPFFTCPRCSSRQLPYIYIYNNALNISIYIPYQPNPIINISINILILPVFLCISGSPFVHL